MFFLLSPTVYAATTNDSTRQAFNQALEDIGNSYFYERPDTALQLYSYYLNKAKDEKLWDEYLHVVLNLASVASHLDSMSMLKRYLEDGQRVLKEYSNVILRYDTIGFLRSNFYYFQGRHYYDLLDYHQAITAFDQILKLREVVSDSLLAFDTHVSLAQSALNLGDFVKAQHHFDLAEHWLPKHHNTYVAGRGYYYQKAFISTQIGHAKYYEARIDNQLESFRQTLDQYQLAWKQLGGLSKKKSSWSLAVTITRSISQCYLDLKNYDSSVYYMQRLLNLPSRSLTDEIYNLVHAVHVRFALQQFDEARIHLRNAQSIMENNFPANHALLGRIIRLKGELCFHQNKLDSAIIYFNEATTYFIKDGLQDNQGIIGDFDILNIYEKKADALAKSGTVADLIVAIQYYKMVVDFAATMRQSFISQQSHQYLLADIYQVFEKALDAIQVFRHKEPQNKSWKEDCLYFFEKNRANHLANNHRQLEAVRAQLIPSGWWEREQLLKGNIAYFKRQLIQKNIGLTKLEQAYDEYEAFTDSLKLFYPEYLDWEGGQQVQKEEDILKILPSDSRLLSFFWGKENLYVLLVDHKTFDMKRLPIEEISSQLIDYLSHIQNPPGTVEELNMELIQAGHSLYVSFREVLTSGHKSYVVIPDGPLAYLPFEALVVDYKADEPDWFLYNATVYYAPGISILLKLLTDSESTSESLSYLGVAPDYGAIQTSSEKNKLAPLSHNREEVRQAGRIFGGTMLFGEKATESNFKKLSGNKQIIHLSAHATVNRLYPNYSAVYFEQDIEDSTEVVQVFEMDGILHLYELYGYQFQAELVVLSGCETGYGTYAKGEGVLSIGRAFQHSGRPAVTLSLWRVSDLSTATIMENYFKHLHNGMSNEQALQSAKIGYLKDPMHKYFQHPYYWAAFILQGNPNPVVSKHNFILFWIFGIVTMLLVGLSTLNLYRRKNRCKKR